MPSTRRRPGPRRPPTTRLTVPAGASQCSASGCRTARSRRLTPPAFDRRHATRARRRPTSSTRRSSRARLTPTRPTSCARRSPACCGPSSSTTTTSTAGCRNGAPIRSTRAADPAPRNDRWHHMMNADVISMPDKWEYPWYAAWDLAFHVLPLTLVDPEFGKQQLDLMLQERYLHPSGQIPAYEWNFGDVNPPVHAWATIFTYRLEKAQRGEGDVDWLERIVPKAAAQLHVVGEPQGSHRQQRVRRGLPRPRQHRRLRPQLAAADRRLPRTGRRHRVDGALLPEHARDRRRAGARERRPMRTWASSSSSTSCGSPRRWCTPATTSGMWDEEDGFFYDVLGCPTGSAQRLRSARMVGPAAAVRGHDVRRASCSTRIPRSSRGCAGSSRHARSSPRSFTTRRSAASTAASSPPILDEAKLRRVLATMLDEEEFLSPYGIRSLSRYHAEHPYVFRTDEQEFQRVVPAGRVRQRHVRRQLELARPDLDAGQRADRPRAAAVLRCISATASPSNARPARAGR